MAKLPKSGRIRIIGGKWKGRKLRVAPGVRPSPDRVRETVFNWLATTLPGGHVLDVFAGSGALAFEALSRGAAAATLVENNQRTARLLERHRGLLEARAAIVRGDALQWLASTTESRFDVVFLDPPFGSGLLAKALPLAAQRLAAAGVVYAEADASFDFAAAERVAGLSVVRAASAGEVRFALLANALCRQREGRAP